MGYRAGVDIGGSFTDFAILDDGTGEVRTLKVFSRPDQPGAEVLAGLAAIEAWHGIAPADISYVTHGTTVGVWRLALFTIHYFRDVLELARLCAPNMYDLLSKRPAPLITRDRMFELDERLRADGTEETPLDTVSVLAAGAEGIVIALLHSHRNPAHEQQARNILARAHPGLLLGRGLADRAGI